MKLAIDCFKQVKGMGKSIGIYNLALNLIRNLANYGNTHEGSLVELYVIGNKFNQEDFDIPGVHFFSVQSLDPRNKLHCIVWELFIVSAFCRKIGADRILFPRGYCALTHPVKDTIIIHDLIPFYYNERFPEAFNKVENAYIMHRLKASAKACDQVITISEASKKDILKYCKIKPEKITVIHNGCNELAYRKGGVSTSKPYICAITSGLPHKNAVGIFRSYIRYCEISSAPLDLKVIGVEDTVGIEVSDEISKKIVYYKYIKEDEKLHAMIANSTVFLFLSLMEGFGFPPIEAMQLGVPVVCSNLSSLPEVVGDAAILVDPNNPCEVANAIENVSTDIALQMNLIEKGKKNINRFSWNSRAELYWTVLTSNGLDFPGGTAKQ